MNKLLNLVLEQKRVKLDFSVIKTIENVTDLIFKKRLKGFRKLTLITSVPITIADGTPGTVEIVVDPNLKYYGLIDHKVEDSSDPNDFILSINPKKITSKKNLYLTLYHEIMHATDPGFSTKDTENYWKDYDPELDEKYWAHPIEFRAYANEFAEALRREFELRKKRLKNEKSILSLYTSLDNILNYFATGESLTKLSYQILDTMSGQIPENNRVSKVLDNISLEFPQIFQYMPGGEKKPYYIITIEMMKRYDQTMWNRFLKLLYDTIQELKKEIKETI
jgi:hypothetical protein